ncbi:hypothetical protein JOL79_15735 [Microbispora sp. RL4-1S]|uniref:Alkaline shock response membrane anchor protein AmaP n=1 Tax=Microbispora oryzae TaxID=2806554 RepID=A0A941AJQ9_9ACTN|nr:hypothetical protein [Microbispora oryzae]MBP2705267.1 hypothetical protein [Microbispora oryzae]
MRPHLGNRVGIGVVGLVLVAGAVWALAVRDARPAARIVDLGLVDPGFFVRNAWAPPLAAGVAMLVALTATRWLAVALGWGRCGSRTGAGTAMLGVALKGVEGVGRIQVRLVAGRRIRASVSLRPEADLHEVIRRLDESAASRVRRAVEGDTLPALVRLHVRRR